MFLWESAKCGNRRKIGRPRNDMYFISDAEKRFNESGPMFHLSTEPVEDAVIFETEDDYIMVNNLIAISLRLSGCAMLAMAIMSNHLHFILAGNREECLFFFEELRSRLQKVFVRRGRGGIVSRMNPGLVTISSLKQLRDEIAYVIRNPFVVRQDVNLFAYRWCSGYLYFNPLLIPKGVPASDLTVRKLRAFTHSKTNINVPKGILIHDGIADPASFIDYKKAESFFDNARQFVMWVLKNVEGQVETSARHGEMPHLNDEELFALSRKLCRLLFKVNAPKELPIEDKKRLALKLKNEFKASNAQIARCSNLSLADVNVLFPLSAGNKH